MQKYAISFEEFEESWKENVPLFLSMHEKDLSDSDLFTLSLTKDEPDSSGTYLYYM